MTVPTLNSVAEFATNGVTTNFPFFFKFLANEDLVVTYVNAAGVSAVLTYGTQYTVNGAGDEDGGSIVTTTALANLGQLIVSREMDAYQQTSLRNQGKFLAETHEDVFDRLTMLIQQGFSIFKRALVRPFGRDYFFAENRRIASIADPVLPQDAVTMSWSQQFFASLIGQLQGPINNSQNVLYIDGDGIATTVQKGIMKQFSSAAAVRTKPGDKNAELGYLLGYYQGTPGIGGGPIYWDSASTESDNGGSVFQVTGVPVGRWKTATPSRMNLYQFGGTYAGNCVAAMDAALASNVETIVVPDNVILGYHVFDCGKKTVIGGTGVSFNSGPCGLWPRNCTDITIKDFINVILAPYPMVGGDIATGQQFVGLATAAVIGNISILGCSGSGGKIGISVGFENGRTLTGLCRIEDCKFSSQYGQNGGEGYGIHYANENDTGDAYLANNTISDNGRHGFYLARNKGGGKILMVGNKVKDHRLNATTQGTATRGAFQINRCANVHGFANSIDGFHDSAIMVFEETEAAVSPIDARNVKFLSTTIRTPRNGTPAIIIGSGTPIAGRLTHDVRFDGVFFRTDGVNCPLLQYGRGKDITFENAHMEYLNIPSATIRPLTYLGNSVDDSGTVSTKNIHFYGRGLGGSTVEVFRLTGVTVTGNIPMLFDGLSMDSDATTNKTWGPSATIANTKIQAVGVDLVGYSGVYPSARPSPSQPWNGKIITSGIATPVGNITPEFIGQEVYLSGNGTWWKAYGLTSAEWKGI